MLTYFSLQFATVNPIALDCLLDQLVHLEVLILDTITDFDNDSPTMWYKLPSLLRLTINGVGRNARRHTLQPARYPQLLTWGYTRFSRESVVETTPLKGFAAACPDLSDIEVWGDCHVLEAVLKGLDPCSDSPQLSSASLAPALRSPVIRAWNAREEEGLENGERAHASLLKHIVAVLRNRAEKGFPPLEELILGVCAPSAGSITSLERLVGDLTMEENCDAEQCTFL